MARLTAAAVADAARAAGLDFIVITDHNNTTHRASRCRRHRCTSSEKKSRRPADMRTCGDCLRARGSISGSRRRILARPTRSTVSSRPRTRPARCSRSTIRSTTAAAAPGNRRFPTTSTASRSGTNEKGPQRRRRSRCGIACCAPDAASRRSAPATGIGLPAPIGSAAVRVFATALTEPAILDGIRRDRVIVMRDAAHRSRRRSAPAAVRPNAGVGGSLTCAANDDVSVHVSMPALADGRADFIWNAARMTTRADRRRHHVHHAGRSPVISASGSTPPTAARSRSPTRSMSRCADSRNAKPAKHATCGLGLRARVRARARDCRPRAGRWAGHAGAGRTRRCADDADRLGAAGLLSSRRPTRDRERVHDRARRLGARAPGRAAARVGDAGPRAAQDQAAARRGGGTAARRRVDRQLLAAAVRQRGAAARAVLAGGGSRRLPAVHDPDAVRSRGARARPVARDRLPRALLPQGSRADAAADLERAARHGEPRRARAEDGGLSLQRRPLGGDGLRSPGDVLGAGRRAGRPRRPADLRRGAEPPRHAARARISARHDPARRLAAIGAQHHRLPAADRRRRRRRRRDVPRRKLAAEGSADRALAHRVREMGHRADPAGRREHTLDRHRRLGLGGLRQGSRAAAGRGRIHSRRRSARARGAHQRGDRPSAGAAQRLSRLSDLQPGLVVPPVRRDARRRPRPADGVDLSGDVAAAAAGDRRGGVRRQGAGAGARRRLEGGDRRIRAADLVADREPDERRPDRVDPDDPRRGRAARDVLARPPRQRRRGALGAAGDGAGHDHPVLSDARSAAAVADRRDGCRHALRVYAGELPRAADRHVVLRDGRRHDRSS